MAPNTTSPFANLPLADFLKETISSVGYETPTPIQAEAIPAVVSGRDLIGLAQTGTGKTAAFVLPLINRLAGQKKIGVRALILAPTRELAEQINDVIKLFTPRTGLKSCTVYGGVSHRNQVSALRGSPAIVVACPGRLKDHMQGRTINLSAVEVLVLDEADRMLDMGFMPDIRHIVRALPADDRQTLLFSATMPQEIEVLSREMLKDPVVVRVKTETPIATVTHSMFTVRSDEKADKLRAWLSENPEALAVVFTKMKHTAKKLDTRLSTAGVEATSLHGNLTQAARQRALNGFREGRYRVMIATDIAARGIDVEGITHVINYDMPDTLDAYIHRTGRAGRASRTGDAVSFVTRDDLSLLRQVEKWLKAPLARLGGASTEAFAGEAASAAPSRERRQGPAARRQGGFRQGARGEGRPTRRAESGPGRERAETRQPRERRSEGTSWSDDRRARAPQARAEAPRYGRSSEGREDSGRQRWQQRGERAERGAASSADRRPSRYSEDRGARGQGGERGPRGAGRSSQGGFSGRQDRSSSGAERSSGKPFRGQRDIDPNSNYVYREPRPHFIGQDERPAGARGRSSRPRQPGTGRTGGRSYPRAGGRGPRRTPGSF